MFELFLSKTPNKEASYAVARKPRHPAKKFSSQFLICARRFFSSKRKRKLLCGVLLLTSRTAGLSAFCIRSGVAEFPPNPPSATPSLPTAIFLAELLSPNTSQMFFNIHKEHPFCTRLDVNKRFPRILFIKNYSCRQIDLSKTKMVL